MNIVCSAGEDMTYFLSNDPSTDTYDFDESGTESITTGGADAPGTISFTWSQLGTDDSTLSRDVSSAAWSYSYDFEL